MEVEAWLTRSPGDSDVDATAHDEFVLACRLSYAPTLAFKVHLLAKAGFTYLRTRAHFLLLCSVAYQQEINVSWDGQTATTEGCLLFSLSLSTSVYGSVWSVVSRCFQMFQVFFLFVDPDSTLVVSERWKAINLARGKQVSAAGCRSGAARWSVDQKWQGLRVSWCLAKIPLPWLWLMYWLMYWLMPMLVLICFLHSSLWSSCGSECTGWCCTNPTLSVVAEVLVTRHNGPRARWLPLLLRLFVPRRMYCITSEGRHTKDHQDTFFWTVQHQCRKKQLPTVLQRRVSRTFQFLKNSWLAMPLRDVIPHPRSKQVSSIELFHVVFDSHIFTLSLAGPGSAGGWGDLPFVRSPSGLHNLVRYESKDFPTHRMVSETGLENPRVRGWGVQCAELFILFSSLVRTCTIFGCIALLWRFDKLWQDHCWSM